MSRLSRFSGRGPGGATLEGAGSDSLSMVSSKPVEMGSVGLVNGYSAKKCLTIAPG